MPYDIEDGIDIAFEAAAKNGCPKVTQWLLKKKRLGYPTLLKFTSSAKLNNQYDLLKVLRNYRLAKNDGCSLESAVTRGHLDVVEKLLNQGVDPSVNNDEILVNAAHQGHTEIARRLLKDDRVVINLEVFKKTISKGRVEILAMILADKRSEKDVINPDLMEAAAYSENAEIFRLLLDDGRVPISRTALQMAIMCCSFDILELIIKDGRVDPKNWSEILFNKAVQEGQLEFIKMLLLDPRIDPHSCTSDLIFKAMTADKYEIVDLLLEDGRFPCEFAYSQVFSRGKLRMLRRFLQDPRIDPSTDNSIAILKALSPRNPLWFALQSEIELPLICFDYLRVLLEDGRIDPSTSNNHALSAAIKARQLDIIEILLRDRRVNEITSLILQLQDMVEDAFRNGSRDEKQIFVPQLSSEFLEDSKRICNQLLNIVGTANDPEIMKLAALEQIDISAVNSYAELVRDSMLELGFGLINSRLTGRLEAIKHLRSADMPPEIVDMIMIDY